MKCLVLFAAVAVVTLEGADVAAAAELPAYESMGLPIMFKRSRPSPL